MKNFPSIKKNKDFRYVYSRGISRAVDSMVMYVLANESSPRIGITASKKVGSSVIRHRFIRRIREIYRAHEANIKEYCDIVVVARRPAADAGYEKLEKDYIRLLKQHRIYIKTEVRDESIQG